MAEPAHPSPERPFAPGTVTRLAAQKHDANRMSVFIDDDFAFGVHLDLVLEFDLYEGRTLTADEQRRIVEADRMKKAMQVAMNYIAYRPRTTEEVRRKLFEQDYDRALVQDVVDELRDRGHLDDAAYAREYAQQRFDSRGYGPVRLRHDLRRRGVDRQWIEQALDELVREESMMEAARAHAKKRWPRLRDEADPYKRRRKLSDYLRRRGFTYGTIHAVVQEVEEQAS